MLGAYLIPNMVDHHYGCEFLGEGQLATAMNKNKQMLHTIIKVDLCMKHLPPPYTTYSEGNSYKVLLCRDEGEHPT